MEVSSTVTVVLIVVGGCVVVSVVDSVETSVVVNVVGTVRID